MRKSLFLAYFLLLNSLFVKAQLSPAILSWMQNTKNITGRHYVSGNFTPINDAVLVNIQSVKYSASFVYVATNGIPAYPTGPFLDGNNK